MEFLLNFTILHGKWFCLFVLIIVLLFKLLVIIEVENEDAITHGKRSILHFPHMKRGEKKRKREGRKKGKEKKRYNGSFGFEDDNIVSWIGKKWWAWIFILPHIKISLLIFSILNIELDWTNPQGTLLWYRSILWFHGKVYVPRNSEW